MIFADTRKAIAVAAVAFVALPIHWPNSPKPAEIEYVRFNLEFGEGINTSLSSGFASTLLSGILTFQIFIARDRGSRPAAEISDTLSVLFDGKTFVEGRTQIAMSGAVGVRTAFDDALWQHNMRITFQSCRNFVIT